MKKVSVALAALIMLLLTSPSSAAEYSQNSRVSAQLSQVRHCTDDLTVYNVTLRNATYTKRVFRAFSVQRGELTSDSRWSVPRRSSSSLVFYVKSGKRMTVTVTHRSEVILHRTLRGICY